MIATAAVALRPHLLRLPGAWVPALVGAAAFAPCRFVGQRPRPAAARTARAGAGLVVLPGMLMVGVLYWIGLRVAWSGWMAARMLQGARRRAAKQRSR